MKDPGLLASDLSLTVDHSSSVPTGFLGGTFDPPHFGHLHLAIELMERCKLVEVWFCPAQANPLKTKPVATIEQRLQMLQLAVEDNPQLRVIDLEAHRPGPSYTIDTIRALHAIETHRQFHLLLGDDALKTFWQWKDANELARLAPPFIGIRSRLPVAPEGSSSLIELLCKGEVSIPVMEISATEIRRRLKARQPCSHLVPGKVLDFIATHQLY